MERTRQERKKKTIIGIAAALIVIAAFALVMHLIEARGLADERLGDSGDWGDGDAGEIYFTFNDKEYMTSDDVDVYMIAGTDGGGLDRGEGYRGELADFITVMVINNTGKKYGFYQVDRNTMVDVPVLNEDGSFDDYAREQLTTAHWYGKTAEERNANLMYAAAEALGGMEPDGYYVINMDDIAAINDAIGGVDVDIEEDMTNADPEFTAGATVHLTGKQAEKYLRARMDVGDGTNAARMRRQQQYMQNAYNMVVSQLRENPEYINDLYQQLEDKVQTDRTGRVVSVIARQLTEYQSMGFLKFSGETKIGDAIDEGVDHEEFYQDQNSVLRELRKVINIVQDDSSDDSSDDSGDADDSAE